MFLAGIVLFNPNIQRLRNNIESILSQVDHIICINNNSDNFEEIDKLISNYDKIKIISNDENKGIGYALNQILEWGRDNKFEWVLTLDQDSICPSNISKEYTKYIKMDRVGLISPLINDINKKKSKVVNNKEIESIENSNEVITSGCLVNVEIWEKSGRFNEALFIDYVDIEYNRRLLNNGYRIIRINSVILAHEIGKIKEYNFIFFKITCSNHSAFRRYYMVRNRLYYNFKYNSKFQFYLSALRLFLGTIKIILLEKDKINKVKATIKGYADYKKVL